jgi:integrase
MTRLPRYQGPGLFDDEPVAEDPQPQANSSATRLVRDRLRVASEPPQRRKRYQFGTLQREARKRPPDVWVYRYSQVIDRKKRRPKIIVGTVLQYPTETDAQRACEHLRMQANAESVRVQVTMRGLIDFYHENVLQPCLDVPIGGNQDVDAAMGFNTARDRKYLLRGWVGPSWEDKLVSDFERPEVCSVADEWFKSLKRSVKNPLGLAPLYVRNIFSAMNELFKCAVKRGYLSQNPIAKGVISLPRGCSLRLTKAAQLTPAQFFQLAPRLGLRERVAVTFAAWLGPRGSETFGLKWSDFDLSTGVVSFRRGFAAGRITKGKNRHSCTDMPLPEDVVQLLRGWHSATPYNEPDDWVFASSVKKGKTPLDRFGLMARHIQPVARKLGLPHISWHSFRHSLSALGKACLTAEERKVMMRHGSLASGEDYGEVSLESKREIAQRLWTHAKLAAKQNIGGLATSASDPPVGVAAGRKASVKIRAEASAPYLSRASKKRVR